MSSIRKTLPKRAAAQKKLFGKKENLQVLGNRMVTESQNLDVYTLKTIIQRCKSGCKQIYEGDIIEQKDTNVQNVGINRLIDVFKGHKSFGCVKLKNNYRSELSELADLM